MYILCLFLCYCGMFCVRVENVIDKKLVGGTLEDAHMLLRHEKSGKLDRTPHKPFRMPVPFAQVNQAEGDALLLQAEAFKVRTAQLCGADDENVLKLQECSDALRSAISDQNTSEYFLHKQVLRNLVETTDALISQIDLGTYVAVEHDLLKLIDTICLPLFVSTDNNRHCWFVCLKMKPRMMTRKEMAQLPEHQRVKVNLFFFCCCIFSKSTENDQPA